MEIKKWFLMGFLELPSSSSLFLKASEMQLFLDISDGFESFDDVEKYFKRMVYEKNNGRIKKIGG